jgi:hypothetical protein
MSRRVLIPAGVLVLAAILGGGWWFTHSDAVDPTGTNVSSLHPGIGRTKYFGEVLSVKRPVKIVSVTPLVSPGAGADVDTFACKQRTPRMRIGSGGLGAAINECEDVRSASGAVVSKEGGWYLIARVIPSTEGKTVIRGFDVTYRDGWRRGHLKTTTTMVVRAAKDQ